MKYKIKIFSTFANPMDCKNVCERIFQLYKMENYGPNDEKEIYITTEDDYTHAFIFNTAMPSLLPTIPKENVVGFAFEPYQYLRITPQFVQYAKKYISKYYIGDVYQLPAPFVGHYGYMWHITPLHQICAIENKPNIMSFIVSHKKDSPGQKYRHALAQEILKTHFPIDIFGSGITGTDRRIKGPFNEHEPYETYRFHICIENHQSDHYFSEKYTNTLLSNCRPIYLGCRNIDNYFPKLSVKLSGNLTTDMNILHHIIRYPSKYSANMDMEEIANKLNPLKNLETIFK
jgi:hypothetical protein